MNKIFIANLLGVALTAAVAQAASPTISCEIKGSNLLISYTGTLYQSSDAVNWTEVKTASSPYQIKTTDKKLFFCARESEGSGESFEPGKNAASQVKREKLDMIWIEPGTFTMGSPENEVGRAWYETPHKVTLTSGYWMSKYEVTQGLYQAVMGKNPSDQPDPWGDYHNIGFNYPVYNVSWNDAKEFCEKLTKILWENGTLPEEYEYTLPTEAQWEYACRAGTTTALNSGKNLSDSTKCPEVDEVAWYGYNTGEFDAHGSWTGNGNVSIVGKKKPNALGLYDMHGNLWEWCSDWYGAYSSSSVTDPTGPDKGTYRVTRGGSWNYDAWRCRSAARMEWTQNDCSSTIGFRVVVVPAPSKDFKVILPQSAAIPMIWIKRGTFTMGSPRDELGRPRVKEGSEDKEALHEVTLSKGFWIGKYEITQGQYQALMGKNPSHIKGSNLPVSYVSWNDAIAFCEKLTSTEKSAGRLPEGYKYTLPTEAQWEYACRAGTTTALNNGKNLTSTAACPNLDEVGWYYFYADGTLNDTLHPVGQKKPNAWGLYDMHGNVNEWCLDWYGVYSSTPVKDPTGPATGTERVHRGGCYYDSANDCRSATRWSWTPDEKYWGSGFRLALTPVQ
jgi:formylglycine-generating enzyme required for sulfatase activity